MSSIRLYMPDSGEAGVIVATRSDGARVEFRGRPYSAWELGEDSPMYQLHAALRRVDISRLHCGEVEIATPWHDEWPVISAMFNEALASTA